MKTSDVMSAYCFLLILFFNSKCGSLWLCCRVLAIDLLSLWLVHNKHLLEILTLPLLQLHLLLECRQVHTRNWPPLEAFKLESTVAFVMHPPVINSDSDDFIYPREAIQFTVNGPKDKYSMTGDMCMILPCMQMVKAERWSGESWAAGDSQTLPWALVWQITGTLFGRRRRLSQGANGSVNLAPALCSSPASSLFPSVCLLVFSGCSLAA